MVVFERDIEEIWHDGQYADMQKELLALMKAFEVCYEITGRSGHYIAPHLLEISPPDYDIEWDEQDNLILTYRYKFKPKNILPRLIVALHEYIEFQRMVWKHGVVFSNGRDRAEVTEDAHYHKSDIRIHISGSDKKRWLSVIGHELDRINASFEHIDYEILFPCSCPDCTNSQMPFEFTYEKLQNACKKRKPIQCHKSLESVDACRLINDVLPAQMRHDKLDDRLAMGLERQDAKYPFSNKLELTVNFPEQQYQEATTVNVGGGVENGQIIVGDRNIIRQSEETNQYGDGDNIAGNKVGADKIDAQVNQLNMAKIGNAIKSLLKDFEQDYNPNTPRGQAKIQGNVLEVIRQDLNLQQQLANIFQSDNEKALEKTIQHPLAAVIIEGMKELIQGSL